MLKIISCATYCICTYIRRYATRMSAFSTKLIKPIVKALKSLVVTMLHSRLGIRCSDVDVTKSLKAGMGERRVYREQRSYYVMGTTLSQVHT